MLLTLKVNKSNHFTHKYIFNSISDMYELHLLQIIQNKLFLFVLKKTRGRQENRVQGLILISNTFAVGLKSGSVKYSFILRDCNI
mgnify:CR=1 FL=1